MMPVTNHKYTTISLFFSLFILSNILSPSTAASRAYPQGCANFPPSYYDYEMYPLPPPGLPSRCRNDFSLLRRLGAGKFSDVFEAVDDGNNNEEIYDSRGSENVDEFYIDPKSLCVIKVLKPVSERKIKRELLVLSHCSDLPNLARLRGVVLSDYHPTTHEQNTTQSSMTFSKDTSTTTTFQINDNGKKQIQAKPILNKVVKNNMPCIILDHAGPHSRWLCHGRGSDLISGSPPILEKSTSKKEQLHGLNNDDDDDIEEDHYLSEYEIKYYLCHLLIALDALHSRGIMHRDVKSRNVLINRRWPPKKTFKNEVKNGWATKRSNEQHEKGSFSSTSKSKKMNGLFMRVMDPPPLTLIDLGLADFYLPNEKYNVRVASRHYKAPELLIGYEYYDYGIDMWGVGCVLAGLLLRREPLFRGKDNVDQLGKIVAILGSEDLFAYCRKYGVHLKRDLENVVQKYTFRNNLSGTRKSWLEVLRESNNARNNKNNPCPVPSRNAMNLLDQLLVYDHGKRLTAREAMMHPFFDDVRQRVELEVQDRWSREHAQKK